MALGPNSSNILRLEKETLVACKYLINNRRMFNVEIVDLAEKPYIPHKSLLQ